jgi:hypothetical protein
MLAEIYGWFTEGFNTADLKDAKALLDELKESRFRSRGNDGSRDLAVPAKRFPAKAADFCPFPFCARELDRKRRGRQYRREHQHRVGRDTSAIRTKRAKISTIASMRMPSKQPSRTAFDSEEYGTCQRAESRGLPTGGLLVSVRPLFNEWKRLISRRAVHS